MSRLAVMTALLAVICLPAAASGPVSIGRLDDLSDFTGTLPYTDATVVADPAHDEAYTIFANEVRIFNGTGMQVHSFLVDPAAWQLTDLSVDERGDLLLLLHTRGPADGSRRWTVMRADFRGRQKGEVELTVPESLAKFDPNRLLTRSGAIWLSSSDQMTAASFSSDGTFLRTVDLAEVAGIASDDRANYGLGGFDVDPAGDVVFAIPVKFKVFVVAPDGGVHSFGRVGSAAGNFGIVSGVVTDDQGHIVVSDRLRNVVMVFDEQYRFVREFGQNGNAKQRLARPGGLAFGADGKLYVSQLGNRGVAVFAIRSEQ